MPQAYFPYDSLRIKRQHTQAPFRSLNTPPLVCTIFFPELILTPETSLPIIAHFLLFVKHFIFEVVGLLDLFPSLVKLCHVRLVPMVLSFYFDCAFTILTLLQTIHHDFEFPSLSSALRPILPEVFNL
jgi:hypothetical protein